jgi:hypothetical protein
MRPFLSVFLLSVLAFGAGFGARIWVDDTRALPPPPAPGGEFVGNRQNAPGPGGGHHPSRADLAAEIERLRPQIDIYRKSMDQIDSDFEHDLLAVLTPAQQDRYNERHKRRTDPRSPRPESTRPLTDEEIMRLRDRPLWSALDHVSVQWKLDDLDRDLKFDDAQLPKVRDLLTQRRDKFLKLIDSVPPPSLTLSRLAPAVQRLAEPTTP